MIKIRIKSTNEIREVTRNIAFDLVDKGEAILFTEQLRTSERPKSRRDLRRERLYANRQIKTE